MLTVKLVLFFCAFLLVDALELDALELPKNPIRQKTFHSSYFNVTDAKSAENVEGPVVLKSNLPVAVQNQLVSALVAIYKSTPDNLQRAQQFQATLARMYPVYWSVVIDFDAITFYSQYYILIGINNGRVLGFGLS